jgi:phosphoribosylformylglycinamidine synthase
MHATLPCPDRSTHVVPSTTNPGATLTALLSHPNIVSKERVIRRYDHEIRGSMIVRPLVGRHDDGHGDGVVVAEPEHAGGLAVGIGVNPWFGLADPERMAHAVIDEAIRNVVAVGGDPDQVALLDNFSWGDPRRPATLGELVAAVQGCCDASIVHRAPFVSGKDSLNNEYLGSDGERHAVPPTLVITAVAAVPDVSRTVDAALRTPGSMLVLVGRTAAEFGGSHLHLVAGSSGGPVPAPDGDAPARYRALYRAIGNGLVEACHDIAEGGLAVAIAEMCIAGRLGADVSDLGHDDPTVGLFAESNGRLVCEIRPDNVTAFRSLVPDTTILGTVTAGPTVRIGPIELGLETLVAAFGAGA